MEVPCIYINKIPQFPVSEPGWRPPHIFHGGTWLYQHGNILNFNQNRHILLQKHKHKKNEILREELDYMKFLREPCFYAVENTCLYVSFIFLDIHLFYDVFFNSLIG